MNRACLAPRIDCRALPKAELHCHLLGVISPELLRKIRDDGGAILVAPEVLDALHPVRCLDSFRRWIEALGPYQTAAPEIMRTVLEAHVESLVTQNVVYTEIMLSPAMFPRPRREMVAALHRWREWANRMEAGQIQIEFLAVVPRSLSREALEWDTEAFLELRREGLICGVALVGVESGESIGRFRESFLRWRGAGLGIEIHAGEHGGPESVRDALEHARPDRLGHGLGAFEDEELLDEMRESKLHIEFCPTSNLRTEAVAHLAGHPAGKARQSGLPFSLNTDDPGAFACSMEGEYRAMEEALGFTSADFETIFKNSLASRFEPKLRYLTPDSMLS